MKSGFLCPSAPLYAGSKLLGIVKGENEVDILAKPMEVDEIFVKAANKEGAAEQKFRFVNKCLKSGCEQWTGSSCGVIERVLNKMEEAAVNNAAPNCSVRPQCRWFSQEGYAACKVCTMVRYI